MTQSIYDMQDWQLINAYRDTERERDEIVEDAESQWNEADYNAVMRGTEALTDYMMELHYELVRRGFRLVNGEWK